MEGASISGWRDTSDFGELGTASRFCGEEAGEGGGRFRHMLDGYPLQRRLSFEPD